MGQSALSDARQVTPEWLTATLRQSGALAAGEVVRVASSHPEKTFASRTWRLGNTCSDDAPEETPAKLFLKPAYLFLGFPDFVLDIGYLLVEGFHDPVLPVNAPFHVKLEQLDFRLAVHIVRFHAAGKKGRGILGL